MDFYRLTLLLRYDKEFEKYLILKDINYDSHQAHYVFRFYNNYGASIVKSIYSYGGTENLWELAVIKFNDDDQYELAYDTYLTDDVLGYLTGPEVCKYLEDIKNYKRFYIY